MDRDYEAPKSASPAKNTKAAKPTSKAASSVEPQQSAKAPPASQSAKTKPAARKRIDYDRIEPGWRAGILSPHQLAALYTEDTGQSVSHAAILKHFRKHGIPRDLSAKIRAKSDAQVTAALVTNEVTAETLKRDRQIVDSGADALTVVRLTQRKDIQRSRAVSMALLEELEAMVGRDTVELMSQLGELMRKENDRGTDRLNDLYHKIISLPERAKTMKDLGESLRVLVALERQAFGLDDKDNATTDRLTELLHGIASRNDNGFTPVAQDPEHADEDD